MLDINGRDISYDFGFDKNKLAKPPAVFSPGYFWSLNDPLDEEVLLEQLHDMYESGARSICIHPMPPEFRPRTMGTQMVPEYLGEDYFKILHRLVDECKKLSMNFYLYDEGAWPSGGAAGRVLAHNPEKFAKKVVCRKEIRLATDSEYIVPTDILCAAIKDDNQISGTFLPGDKIHPDNDVCVQLFYVDKKRCDQLGHAGLPDLFCSEAVEKFIELTHERYNKYLGDELGKTIQFAFTDEPAVSYTVLSGDHVWQLTWTDDMAEEFKSRKGYDLIPYIPHLHKDRLTDEITTVLLDFYDVWSELFAERFLHPIKVWCNKHNVLSSGHMGGEDKPICNATVGFGHILRSLRELDIPGIDTIWRQIFPENPETLIFPKYATSIARQQDGTDLVLSESFMVYGSGLSPAQMKWIIDQQLALGVNVFVFGHYMYSTRDHYMAFCRPFFGPFNPFWKYMKQLHLYTERMSYLLSRGHSDCSIAVYYPIRDIWAGSDCREKAIESHDEIAKVLLEKQIDFDYIDDDVLIPENINSGMLQVGEMEYSTIVVPEVKWMTEYSLKAIDEFSDAGGRVITVGDSMFATQSTQNITNNLVPQLGITPAQPAIRVNKRICDECTIYFISNSKDHELTAEFAFSENMPAVLYDANNNSYARLTSDANNYILQFPPWESKTFIFTETPEAFSSSNTYAVPNYTEELSLTTGWLFRVLRQYCVGEHDYEIVEYDNSKYKKTQLGDWRLILGDDFCGDVEYYIEFDYSPEADKLFTVDLGQLKYAATVILNENNLGCALWPPFTFDISQILKCGKNVLKIIVSNSLANPLLADGIKESWHQKLGKTWPVQEFAYDDRQREYEKDSLPSGLYGPVKILVSNNQLS
jgi:glycosyl hydrolase family 106( putative alpha-L-rhamnosidase)